MLLENHIKHYNITPTINVEGTNNIWNEDWHDYTSNRVKCLNKSTELKGVCFNFALNNIEYWIESCGEAYDILYENYLSINISEAKQGDIISYHEVLYNGIEKLNISCNNAVHFAKIKSTDGTIKGTIIESKWGEDGVFETNIEDVLDIYGNVIVIWRKK